MKLDGTALLARIYIGESDHHDGRPLYEAIVALLRERGIAGATVLRGIEGYGRAARLHTSRILRLSEDLPILIEVVDREDRLRSVLPEIDALVGGGPHHARTRRSHRLPLAREVGEAGEAGERVIPHRIMRRTLTVILALCLALVATVSSAAAQEIERRPVEDPLFGVSSVVPADWQDLGGGIYARGTPPDDLALIAIQSASATVDQLWPSLLPQFALTEVPEVTGEYQQRPLRLDALPLRRAARRDGHRCRVGRGAGGGTTHLLLLQSDPAEFDVLREQVLMPAIDAFAVLEPEPTPDPSTFDYQIEEVTFPGGAEGVQLAGTLTLPDWPRSTPGRRHHERQRRPGPRRVDAADHDA